MKMKIFSWVVVCVLVLVGSDNARAAIKFSDLIRVGSKCNSCHRPEVQDFEQNGAAHKAELSCADCHQGDHPPPMDNPSAMCADCHDPEEQNHFKAADCVSCHHPHHPLNIDLSKVKNAKPGCVTCHPEPGAQTDAHPSAHSEMGCNECHLEHGAVPECATCHAPDEAAHFSLKNCTTCHAPHAPTTLDYSKLPIDRTVCFTCHEQPAKDFKSQESAHKDLDCRECHQSHGQSPFCMECHEPHAETMSDQDCLRCHKPHRPKAAWYDQKVAPNLCAACHDDVVSLNQKHGGPHKDAVGCLDCHTGHPPEGKNVIPSCNQCHPAADNDHYLGKGCTGCHPAHAPAKIDFANLKGGTAVCISCHEGPGAEFKAKPSAHAELKCWECHQAHGKSPSCMECHEPHSPSMTYEDCLRCHQPHQPKTLWQAGTIDPTLCQTCHKDVVSSYEQQGGPHKAELGCLDCHQAHPPEEDGVIPACTMCHDAGERAHFALKNCASCHNPHALEAFDFENQKIPNTVCGTCHEGPGKQIAENPSAHAEMGCRDCHQGSHGTIPACADCHDPHSEKMTQKDCRQCHQAHNPVAQWGEGVTAQQCRSCHEDTVTAFIQKGTAHKKALSCTECHQAHPPAETGVIPACSDCHDPGENPHFAGTGCASCHNPHTPRHIEFSGVENVKPVCVSCHGYKKYLQDKFPTAHVELDCKECHEVHREFQQCTECHEPHSEGMVFEDCQKCHQVHRELPVKYSAEVSASLCSGCHEEIVATVAEKGSRHRTEAACTDCHTNHPPAEEGVIPVCGQCHAPESQAHFALEDCSRCHEPHQPLEMDLLAVGLVRPVCISCHTEQGEQTEVHPSSHSTNDCTMCHLAHGEALECMECHDAHSETMVYVDCLKCHQPHMPTAIQFEEPVAASLCSSCHASQVKDLEQRGVAHKTEVGCLGCHTGHLGVGCRECHEENPDKQAMPLPVCSQCHAPADNSHFAINGCARCHAAHSPMDLDLAEAQNVKPACVSCHFGVGLEMQQNPSAHADSDCNMCHLKHGEALQCSECHQAHQKDMSFEDCQNCHRPHQPTAIAFAGTIPSGYCASCHKEQVAVIDASGASHKTKVGCQDCHQAHPPSADKVIPNCNECHPRLRKVHYTVDNCTGCHLPHAPREINFAKVKTVRAACVSCHAAPGRFLRTYPSAHTELDCKECHAAHKEATGCLNCHDPHTKEMAYQDCLNCHDPHRPTVVQFNPEAEFPSGFCAGCHQEPAQGLAKNGGRHASAVVCADCHREHPPYGKQVIPSCGECHVVGQNPHFAVGNCSDCHQAHSATAVDLSATEEAKPVCLSCHQEQGQEMARVPSAHAELDCKLCHQQHGEFTECLDCHNGHSKEMAYKDCRSCHQPHSPTVVEYGQEIPTPFCAACHDEVATALANSSMKHSSFDCVFCHKDRHMNVMTCDSCHGQPHAPDLHGKYPNCLNCHEDPHALAEWRKN